MHGKAKKREGGWEVTIFGGLSGRDGGEGGYRRKPGMGGLLFGREYFNEFLMFDFGKGIKLFH